MKTSTTTDSKSPTPEMIVESFTEAINKIKAIPPIAWKLIVSPDLYARLVHMPSGAPTFKGIIVQDHLLLHLGEWFMMDHDYNVLACNGRKLAFHIIAETMKRKE